MSFTLNARSLKKFFMNGLFLGMIFFLGLMQLVVLSRVEHYQLENQTEPYWGQYANTKLINRFLYFQVAAADLVWIDLIYKADIVHEKVGFSGFYKTMRSIMTLDSKNYLAFWFGALYLSVIKDDIPGATTLFQDTVYALEQDDWVESSLKGSIFFAYGYHLMFEEQDFDLGAKYIIKSADQEGATVLAKQMAQTLSTERGQVEVGFRVLNDFYKRARTDNERAAVEKKMTRLLVKKELIDLNEKFNDYKLRSDSEKLPRNTVFRLFLRSINHKGKNILGQKLTLDQTGKINVEEKSQ